MTLEGKTVVVGITGGIAAYKMPDTVRLLVRAGAAVRPILTRGGERFVTPLTLQTVAAHPVARDTFDLDEEARIGHIRLADEADVLLIAPATANVLAKLACGLADDLLTTVALATRAPLVVAPAMNVHMWEHPTVRDNVARLAARGVAIVAPDRGHLACGYEGEGRLPDPAVLVEEVAVAATPKSLRDLRVLVTAGPTWERIDPVRHVANRSSGKMGYAVARVARRHGARVTLITGPTALPAPHGVPTERVTTAAEMQRATLACAADADVVVMAAAVGDYRPTTAARHKIKRARADLALTLVPNPDILAEVARLPGSRLLVGFAAETRDLVANARRKLQAKGVHLMVANDVTAEGAGFDVDTNVVTFLHRSGKIERVEKMSKEAVAEQLVARIAELRRPPHALTLGVRRARPRR